MKNGYVNNNGILIPIDSYSLKVGNRGHLYGDGFFESIRVINGKMINFENHFKRIIETVKVLKMKTSSGFTEENLSIEIQNLIDQNGITQGGRIRLSIDRKPGGNYLPRTNEIDFYIEAYTLPNNNFELNDAGYRIDLYNELKKPITFLSNFKTKNALVYIMAKLHAREKQLDDVLLQNEKMGIIESSSANLFIVSNGVLYTPGLDSGCLGGTMRMQIINLAIQNNIKIYECNITPQNLLTADEVFLTNAVRGIIWVGKYRTKEYGSTMASKINSFLVDNWAKNQ